MNKEIWKAVKFRGVDYTGLYEVSSLGRFARIENGIRVVVEQQQRERMAKRRGVYLKKGKSSATTHLSRVVGETFLRTPQRGEVVDHINNDPTDNRLCNLQVISSAENTTKDRKGKNGLPVGVAKIVNKKGRVRYRSSITRTAKGSKRGFKITLGEYAKPSNARKAYLIACDTLGFRVPAKEVKKLTKRVILDINEFRLSIDLRPLRRKS